MVHKKLLVLCLNGLLVDKYFHRDVTPYQSPPDAILGNFHVYKRPFCQEFLQFCFDNFVVGVWSSARDYNIRSLVDYLFGDERERLAFCWHQSDCTDVGLTSPDNKCKPLFFKELSKLWNKAKPNLPWNEGDYGPSNTLLVDHTPYKAMLNPPDTAIFPRTYTIEDHGDDFLDVDLRKYLEGIRDAEDVQEYVKSNPIGEPSIPEDSPLRVYVRDAIPNIHDVERKLKDLLIKDGKNCKTYEHVNNVTGKQGYERRRRRYRSTRVTENINDINISSEAVELQSSEVGSSRPTETDSSGDRKAVLLAGST